MADSDENLHEEIQDLKRELENFEQEKERVRTILGSVGGVPRSRARLINWIFITIVVVSVIASFFLKSDRWHLLMIEIATITLSIKIIYLMHYQMRVDHFQFWILSAIEWRINEMMSTMRKKERLQEPGA